MRIVAIIAWIVTLPVLMAADAKDDATIELKKFEGTWKPLRVEKEGKLLADEKLKTMKVTITGDRIAIKDDAVEDVAVLKIDATKKPAEITFYPDGDEKVSAPGIYSFEGETLKICFARVGGERPKDFASKAENETRFFILMKVPR